MSSIEIQDSDEDNETCSKGKVLKLESAYNEEERSVTPKLAETESNYETTNNNNNERTPKKGTESKESATSPNSSDGATSSPTTANGADSTDNTKPARHRARKTQHQPRPTDTDIQFETIAPANDSGPETHEEPGAKVQQEEAVARNQIRVAITEMLNEQEMQAQIKKIAKERVRCNFLLATYQLPDMNFTLNTTIDTLRNQFQERLKQRREKARLASSVKGFPVRKKM